MRNQTANLYNVLSLKSNDEQRFKWAVIAALHHKVIAKNPHSLSKLQNYEGKYKWQGLEVPLVIKEIGKFQKKNAVIEANVLFNDKESIYTAHRPEINRKCSKQVRLRMILD